MTKLRDLLLESGLPAKEYFNQDTSDKAKYIKPKEDIDKKIKVPNDPYEKGKNEDTVRSECNKWLKETGWIVKTIYSGSIPLPNGGRAKNPNIGVPDCIIFKGKNKLWIEYKRTEGGHTTIFQRNYHYLLRSTGDTVLIISSLTMLKHEFKRLEIC
jgi:hypothetical protein